MAITMQYRGVEFIKSWVVRYLKSIFYAQEKGSLLLTDGTNKIEFSRTPTVIKMHSWTYRDIPAVLIGPTSGNFVERTFAKNLVLNEGVEDTGQQVYEGGDIDVSLDLSIRARTIPERDNLVDTVCIFMSNRTAKEYFERQDIKIPTPPSIGGESEIMEPDADYPIFATGVSLTLHSSWVEWTEIGDRLIDIITDVEALVEF